MAEARGGPLILARIEIAEMLRGWTHYYRAPSPWVTIALIIAMSLTLGLQVLTIVQGAAVYEGAFVLDETWPDKPWTLVTSPLAHKGLPHLLPNLTGLLLFGPIVERSLKPTRYLLLFFAASSASSLAGLYADQAFGLGFGASALGASGGIFSLMGYATVNTIREWRRLPPPPWIQWANAVPHVYSFLRSRGVHEIIAIIVALKMTLDLFRWESQDPTLGAIGNVAHATGLGLGIIVAGRARKPNVQRMQTEEEARVEEAANRTLIQISIAILVTGLAIVAVSASRNTYPPWLDAAMSGASGLAVAVLTYELLRIEKRRDERDTPRLRIHSMSLGHGDIIFDVVNEGAKDGALKGAYTSRTGMDSKIERYPMTVDDMSGGLPQDYLIRSGDRRTFKAKPTGEVERQVAGTWLATKRRPGHEPWMGNDIGPADLIIEAVIGGSAQRALPIHYVDGSPAREDEHGNPTR